MPSPTFPPLQPTPFHVGWTLEDTERYLSTAENRPDSNQSAAGGNILEAWRKDVWEPLQDSLTYAMACHLCHEAHTNGLVMPPNTEGVSLPWLKAWRQLVNTKTIDAQDLFLVHQCVEVFRLGYWLDMSKYLDNKSPTQVHDALCARVQSGIFRFMDTELGNCQSTGTRLHLEINHWIPTIGTRDINFKDKAPAPLRPLTPGQFFTPPLNHASFDVPSGELWISDWIRIPEFTALCEKARLGIPNINGDAGVVAQTKIYAEQLGFMSIFVGNSCPNIVLSDGVLKIGDNASAPKSHSEKKVGSICTDLWWATLIDKQTLINLLAQTQPLHSAQKTVEKYQKDNSRRITCLKVPAGTRHLYFSGHPSIFKEHCKSPEIDWTGWSAPMGVLSDRPLELGNPDMIAPKSTRTKPR